MKKNILITFLLTAVLLSSCDFNKDQIEKDESLIFTEFALGKSFNDRALEVTNISNKSIDLSNYEICNYRYESGKDEPSETIPLSGVLEPNQTYVVCFSDATSQFLEKADLVSPDLLNDGSFSVSLKYKKKYIVDCIGTVGFGVDVARNSDLVRKKEYFVARHSLYEAYDWVRYPKGDTSHLGNLDCISETELLDGPKLTQENFDTPFAVSSTQGTGGAYEVSLTYTMDGDTTKFNFGNKYSSFGISGSNSIRYFGINTPEIAHSYDEVSDPFGDEAQAFTNRILNSSAHFVVQSVKNNPLFETYGRVLGYVWVTNSVNPTPESYSLMSFKIVLNGFARVGFVNRMNLDDTCLLYKGINYEEYLYNAENFAKLHKLNIHSVE